MKQMTKDKIDQDANHERTKISRASPKKAWNVKTNQPHGKLEAKDEISEAFAASVTS
jgi:hypothetical protein